jgi:hypothetical protein
VFSATCDVRVTDYLSDQWQLVPTGGIAVGTSFEMNLPGLIDSFDCPANRRAYFGVYRINGPHQPSGFLSLNAIEPAKLLLIGLGAVIVRTHSIQERISSNLKSHCPHFGCQKSVSRQWFAAVSASCKSANAFIVTPCFFSLKSAKSRRNLTAKPSLAQESCR